MGAILFQMTIQALQCLEMANQSIVNYRGMLNIYLIIRKKLAWQFYARTKKKQIQQDSFKTIVLFLVLLIGL